MNSSFLFIQKNRCTKFILKIFTYYAEFTLQQRRRNRKGIPQRTKGRRWKAVREVSRKSLVPLGRNTDLWRGWLLCSSRVCRSWVSIIRKPAILVTI